MTYIPSNLRELVEQARGGTAEVPSVEILLSWYRTQRRSPHVVQQIRAGFSELGVRSEPDFEGAFLEAPLKLVPTGSLQAGRRPEEDVPAEGLSDIPTSEKEFSDPTYRIGRLEAANRVPIMVRPEVLLAEAVTLMLKHDVSQLPVASSERSVVGLVSWKSIGCALALGKSCKSVRECMDVHHEIRIDASLFSAISSIIQFEHAIVKDRSGKVCGIVTSADLSVQFGRLAEPFLLIGEIENHLRRIIDKKCGPDVIKAAKDPKDTNREVSSAADLAFGEYIRLFENPAVWVAVQIQIDRKLFIGMLKDVRRIRNEVMHFDPDGIEPRDEKVLRDLVHLLQTLAYYGAI